MIILNTEFITRSIDSSVGKSVVLSLRTPWFPISTRSCKKQRRRNGKQTLSKLSINKQTNITNKTKNTLTAKYMGF